MIDWRVRDPKKDYRSHGKGASLDRDIQSRISTGRRIRPQYRHHHPETKEAGTDVVVEEKKGSQSSSSSSTPASIPPTAPPSTTTTLRVPFRCLTQFNATPTSRTDAGLNQRLTLLPDTDTTRYKFTSTKKYFGGSNALLSKLAMSLAKREAMDMKEFR